MLKSPTNGVNVEATKMGKLIIDVVAKHNLQLTPRQMGNLVFDLMDAVDEIYQAGHTDGMDAAAARMSE